MFLPIFQWKVGEARSAGCIHGKAAQKSLVWSRLGVEPAELFKIAENREVFRVLLELLPPLPSPRKNRYENEWSENSKQIRKSL